MKGRYFGPLTRDELFQALIEDKEGFFAKHGINHFKFASFNFFPIDEYGQPVMVYDPETRERIHGYDRKGYYKSAACAYEIKCFEPKLVRLPRFDP